MSCRCDECGWPVHTDHQITLRCPKCSHTIECSDGPLPPVVERAIPLERWPSWALLLSRWFRSPEDTGVGDSFARLAERFGGERIKAFSKRWGIPCGCTARQTAWNTRYPYAS